MDQKQIQIVLSVAKNLSFSEAAYETSYAASVVSKQVSSLENELGVRIFERKARSKVALTEIGQQIIPYLTSIQNEYERMRKSIGSLTDSKVIKLICPRGFSGLGEDELISIFCARNPDIEVRQLEGCSLDCQTLLANGDVDVSVRMFTKTQLGENRSYAQNLAFTKLAENYVGVVLRNDYPAICDGQVDLAKLREETFCFRAFDEKTQCDPKIECFREACRSEGFEPILQFYKDIRPGAVYAMAAKGLCVIPSMHPPTSLYPGLCYVPLTKQYYSFTIGMQYRKDNPSLAVKRFIKCAQEHARLFSADSSSVSLK